MRTNTTKIGIILEILAFRKLQCKVFPTPGLACATQSLTQNIKNEEAALETRVLNICGFISLTILSVCMCEHVHAGEGAGEVSGRGTRTPGAGVTCSCELPDAGAGN